MPNLESLIAQFESLVRARAATSVADSEARVARSTLEFRSVLLRLAPPLSPADGSAAPTPWRAAPARPWEPLAAAPAGAAVALEGAPLQAGAAPAYRGRSPARGLTQSAQRTLGAAAAEAQQPLTAPGAPAGAASSAGAGAGASAATAALLAVFLLCLLAALLPARLALDPSPLRSIVLSWRLERPG
jgi:hypothetical protein